MYESSIIEPTEIGEFLETVNSESYELVSMVNLSDSNQLLIVVKKPEVKKPFFKPVEKEKED